VPSFRRLNGVDLPRAIGATSQLFDRYLSGCKYLPLRFFTFGQPVEVGKDDGDDIFREFLKINHGDLLVKADDKYSTSGMYPKANYLNIVKYNNEPIVLEGREDVALQKAIKALYSHFGPYLNNSKIMSYDEIALASNRPASAGYPFKLKYKNKGLALDCLEFRKFFENYWDEECRDLVVWESIVKHELRTREKLEDDDLRVYTLGPVHHNTALSKCCLAMNETLVSTLFEHCSAIGISLFYGEWNQLYRTVTALYYWLHTDVAKMDAKMRAFILEIIRDFRIWCSSDHTIKIKNIFHNLYSAMIYSLIKLDWGEIVQKFMGNPTGSACTAYDNTFGLFIMIMFVWFYYGPADITLDDFLEKVRMFIYGDDNIMSIHHSVIHWFNPWSLRAGFAILGMQLKDEECIWRSEMTFLSHGFKRYNDIFLPYYDTIKAIAGLLLHTNYKGYRWSLYRANAIRLETWPNEELRLILTNFIQHCIKNVDKMRLEYNSELTIDRAFSNNFSDLAIYRLYTKNE